MGFISGPKPKVIECKRKDRTAVELLDNGTFFYVLDSERINWAHSQANIIDGRTINTRTAKKTRTHTFEIQDELGKGQTISIFYEENELTLEQRITQYEAKQYIIAQVFVTDTIRETETRFIAPIDTPYPDVSGKKLFFSLDQRMLLVPYDNDMWVRYESTPPRPGRTSYDVTAIYDEINREGLVIGAIDHNPWKNAIAWSACDARSIIAYCGAADPTTHDIMPHGVVRGKTVASSRFMIGWYSDIRIGMEEFGKICTNIRPGCKWNGTVPFGWNSFSALSVGLRLKHWQAAGDFIFNDLPNYRDANGVTYINLDANFFLNPIKMKKIIAVFHARGQKVGTYAAPFVWMKRFDWVPLKGKTGLKYRDIFLKDDKGRPLPPIDGLSPLDTTHPAWEAHVRATLKQIVETGFDYLKIDFVSHGAVEGARFDPTITTGRMALNRAYCIMQEELDHRKIGREIFISLSIAPLFPHGFGHSRRCCCDSFGHHEDVRYVLNALNFGWWTNGSLYSYNDPDHIVLYNSVVDGRGPTTIEEARSRYNAAVISGTVMMLSDNYGPDNDNELIEQAKHRAIELANNTQLNEIVRFGKVFIPVELSDGTTPVYTLKHQGKIYIALFNFKSQPAIVSVEADRADLPENGNMYDLNRDISYIYKKKISMNLAPWDSAILIIS